MTPRIVNAAPAGYVDVREASELLGGAPSYKTLARWCDAGRIVGAQRQEWSGRAGFRWIVPRAWVRRQAKATP